MLCFLSPQLVLRNWRVKRGFHRFTQILLFAILASFLICVNP